MVFPCCITAQTDSRHEHKDMVARVCMQNGLGSKAPAAVAAKFSQGDALQEWQDTLYASCLHCVELCSSEAQERY